MPAARLARPRLAAVPGPARAGPALAGRADRRCWASAVCCGLWWFVTRGEPEERIISPSNGLPSPAETFASFHSLWFDRGLTRNLLTTLRRVVLGFGLATLVGVPLGVLCGCFSRVNAFFLPLTLFGRNIPVAALIPLTFSLFGIGELQKVMFIFIACVAFIVSDTARAIGDVGEPYVDTAYTLGASRWQIDPQGAGAAGDAERLQLAAAAVRAGLRLHHAGRGRSSSAAKSGGLGDIINTSQRRGPREHVLLVLLIIPVVALAIDRVLFWIQQELFPYRYGGSGPAAHAGAWRHARLGRPEGARLAAGHPRGSPGRA